MRKSTLPILALVFSWAGVFLLGLFWGEPWGAGKTITVILGPMLIVAVFATDWLRRTADAMVHEHRRTSAR
jgi:hypothetical protein